MSNELEVELCTCRVIELCLVFSARMSGSGTEPLGIVTLDPGYNEFGYIEHAATTNRSLYPNQ